MLLLEFEIIEKFVFLSILVIVENF